MKEKEKEEVDQERMAHKNAPWSVKKGGFILPVYNHSLSISLGILFVLSLIFHFTGSLKNYDEEQSILLILNFGLNLFRTGKVNFLP
ncbi:hypothetical protein J3D55_002261 [Chryseobacterium ginsenosidimutans]|uniref:DUF6766 family protein n=1 Tax=Chryseobacterium ginsenosidimutans TaxID=687846 RepID=UPI002169FCEB|nr:DUF6766 family protein [Chryseobacterium ginsenosidimutans]MCS3869345.1 hypothetical protein [Chryseobacterium ginsenosidimutans]